MSMRGTLLIGVLSLLLFHARLFGLTIQFDYSFDTNRLVTGHSEQFDFVAAELEERIHDNLLAITVPPTSIIHPSTGEYVSVGQMDVPGDTIIVYVGAYDLPGDRFAQAHFDFSSTPNNRGQSAMDLGIWTGSISFDSLTNWQEYHIYSVLRHELLHVLGFGLCLRSSHKSTTLSFWDQWRLLNMEAQFRCPLTNCIWQWKAALVW